MTDLYKCNLLTISLGSSDMAPFLVFLVPYNILVVDSKFQTVSQTGSDEGGTSEPVPKADLAAAPPERHDGVKKVQFEHKEPEVAPKHFVGSLRDLAISVKAIPGHARWGAHVKDNIHNLLSDQPEIIDKAMG